jgi:hypothetical protein
LLIDPPNNRRFTLKAFGIPAVVFPIAAMLSRGA